MCLKENNRNCIKLEKEITATKTVLYNHKTKL